MEETLNSHCSPSRSSISKQNQLGQNARTGDRHLLSRAQAGEMSAFEQLVQRHRDRVYSLGLWVTFSAADAEAIAQETFLSACRHLKEFRTEADFGAWVHRVAAIRARLRPAHRDPVQAGRRDLELLQLDGSRGRPVYPGSDWSRVDDESTLDAELRQAIENATERLPQDHREVLLFRDLAGMSEAEIADVRGESIALVKSRLRRARLNMRDAIERVVVTSPFLSSDETD